MRIAQRAFVIVVVADGVSPTVVVVIVVADIRQMNLESNELVQVDSLGALHALQSLNLSRNRVESIGDGAWRHLRALELLFLSDNRIVQVADLHLQAQARLRLLNLRGNRVVRIGPGTFRSLGQLRELNLADNALGDVADDGLAGLGQLRQLAVDGNALRALRAFAAGLARHCPRLMALSARANRFDGLGDVDVLAQLTSLVELALAGNPLARKYLYRPTIVHVLAGVQVVDGREVSAADVARAQALLVGGPADSVTAPAPTGPAALTLPLALLGEMRPACDDPANIFGNVFAIKGLSARRPPTVRTTSPRRTPASAARRRLSRRQAGKGANPSARASQVRMLLQHDRIM